MRKTSLQRWQINELLIPASIFLILVWYTYGILFVVPYSGFAFSIGSGRILEIYSQSEHSPSLQIDDVLVQIGSISWESYKKDARLVFFEDVQAGEIVEITVNRNGTEIVIPWKFMGFNQSIFNKRFINIWGLAFIFWFFGAAAQLLIRPKEGRRRLFIAANYLTALWLIFGSLSSFQLWGSSLLLHAVTWLLLPVYLHLHWVFPRPLSELPKTAWILVYLAGFLFAAAEIAQVLPKSLYALAFLTALLGSLVLEITHYIRQTDQRRDVSLLAVSIFLSFTPSIIFGILVIAGAAPYFAPAALFAMPFMPLAYFYIIYRRQSGGMEVRLNRLISLYAFLILFGTVLFSLVIPITSLNNNFETLVFIGVLVILASIFMAITIFPAFQAFVEKRYLGIKLPYQNLQELYSSRIAASTSTNDLLQLLEGEVFPSVFIRQFAFSQVFNGKLKTLLTANVTSEQLPHENDMQLLISQAGMYLSDVSPNSGWIRLILPLKAGDSLIGFWLLGRRDPDDLYPQAEISILQSIANQTAIALSNILHAEQVRMLFQLDVERYEQERLSLALDLHDSILNQLAVFHNSLGETILSPNLQDSYEEITHRLREIVSELRPPMLMYGLKPAIVELADNLMERSGDKVKIKVDMEASGERAPERMEQHLFRIVQEACENSLRHAEAKSISIYGTLTPEKVDLNIHDDGKGFDADSKLEMDNLLANHHFGLSNMIERAALIGAKIKIHSGPNTGTRIHLTWSNNHGKI
jgi:signal transduction histidine kinase